MNNRYSFPFKIMTMHSSDKGQQRANTISNSATISGLKVLLLNWSHTSQQYDYYLLGLEGSEDNFNKFKQSAKELGAVQNFSRL